MDGQVPIVLLQFALSPVLTDTVIFQDNVHAIMDGLISFARRVRNYICTAIEININAK